MMHREALFGQPGAVPIGLTEADDLLLDPGQGMRGETVKERLGASELEAPNDMCDAHYDCDIAARAPR